MAACGVTVSVRTQPGAQPLSALAPGSFVVANHVSWMDIFVIDSRCAVSFVAKAEIARWPLVGLLVARTGNLFIERGRRHAVHRMLIIMMELHFVVPLLRIKYPRSIVIGWRIVHLQPLVIPFDSVPVLLTSLVVHCRLLGRNNIICMLSINYYVCVDYIDGIINITLMRMEAAASAATSHRR